MTKIVIDPGHGGSDSGAVHGGHREKDFNLQIALKVREYLQDHYEADILMTRTTDKTVSLRERTDFANHHNADYFCSIHINAGGGTGWESYIYNGTVSDKTKQAQNKIHSKVMSILSSKYEVRDRGKKRANFHVLRETRMSAILTENLFIDTTRDLDLLTNATFIQDLAHATGEGMAEALSLQPVEDTFYRVIAGSFQNKNNAVRRQQLLEENGIDSFLIEVEVSGKTWYRVQAGAFRKRTNAESRLGKVKRLGIEDAYIFES